MNKEEEQILYYKPIFECILSSVESFGGDGSGLLYIRESFCAYEQIAEMFEDFLSEKGRQWKNKDDRNSVIFWNEQEYIIIGVRDFYYYDTNVHFDIKIETW